MGTSPRERSDLPFCTASTRGGVRGHPQYPVQQTPHTRPKKKTKEKNVNPFVTNNEGWGWAGVERKRACSVSVVASVSVWVTGYVKGVHLLPSLTLRKIYIAPKQAGSGYETGTLIRVTE